MRPLLLPLILPLVTSCATMRNELHIAHLAPPQTCQRYANRYLIYGLTAVGSLSAAGVGGLTTQANMPDNWRMGLNVTSTALGAIGTVSAFVSGYYIALWAKCK